MARTASGAPDQHREGDWVSVQPTQGPPALPQWTARQPCMLWLCVRPGLSEGNTGLAHPCWHICLCFGAVPCSAQDLPTNCKCPLRPRQVTTFWRRAPVHRVEERVVVVSIDPVAGMQT